jgi:hypothetical protein
MGFLGISLHPCIIFLLMYIDNSFAKVFPGDRRLNNVYFLDSLAKLHQSPRDLGGGKESQDMVPSV